MVYIDLNFVCVNFVFMFEELDFISVKYCINVCWVRKLFLFLKFFLGCIDKWGCFVLFIMLDSYLSLVDEIGRYVRNDKKGIISFLL